MTDILSFEFEQNLYKAIISRNENVSDFVYRITIMNGELEKLLFGFHTFQVKSGQFLFTNTNAVVAKLQHAITHALGIHFGK